MLGHTHFLKPHLPHLPGWECMRSASSCAIVHVSIRPAIVVLHWHKPFNWASHLIFISASKVKHEYSHCLTVWLGRKECNWQNCTSVIRSNKVPFFFQCVLTRWSFLRGSRTSPQRRKGAHDLDPDPCFWGLEPVCILINTYLVKRYYF